MTTTAPPFPAGCQWLIEVASGNPEPDFPEDCVQIIPCGCKVEIVDYRLNDGSVAQGWRCEGGHEHVPIEIALAPYGPEWERDQQDRFEETGAWF